MFEGSYIKYELGIGVSYKKQPIKQEITFYGKWMVLKNIGLVFEVTQEGKQIQQIIFGAQARLTDKGIVSFTLRNSLNKDIGVELELERDILKGDGQAFLRILKEKKELAILVGVGWRW